MSKLTTRQRNNLPASDFAIPKERRYPIEDLAHARDALSRVAANGTPAEKAVVRAAVYKRYPGLKKRKEARQGMAEKMAS